MPCRLLGQMSVPPHPQTVRMPLFCHDQAPKAAIPPPHNPHTPTPPPPTTTTPRVHTFGASFGHSSMSRSPIDVLSVTCCVLSDNTAALYHAIPSYSPFACGVSNCQNLTGGWKTKLLQANRSRLLMVIPCCCCWSWQWMYELQGAAEAQHTA